MKKTLLSIAILTSAVFSASAMAGQVTCASTDGKYKECRLDGSGDIIMKTQLSKTDCVKDKTWGETANGVYVKGGCRAIFETMSMSQPQTMAGGSGYKDLIGAKAAGGESDLQRRGYKFVKTSTQGNSKLSTWWKPNRTGCIQVTTSDGRYSAIREVNSSQCGQSSVAPAVSNNGKAPAAAIAACNKFAGEGYDGTIISQSAMKPGWWEIVFRFEQNRYVCNVSSSGNVESFNKLN